MDAATVDIEAKNVIKIDPEGKYIIILPERDGVEGHAMYTLGIKTIRDWWEGDDPFLFMPDSFKLVRVDESEVVAE